MPPVREVTTLDDQRARLGMSVSELARRAKLSGMRTRRILAGDAAPSDAEREALERVLEDARSIRIVKP